MRDVVDLMESGRVHRPRSEESGRLRNIPRSLGEDLVDVGDFLDEFGTLRDDENEAVPRNTRPRRRKTK